MSEIAETEQIVFVDGLSNGNSYPAIKNPQELKKNAKTILDAISVHFDVKPVRFVGTGTSGTTYMTAIMMREDADKNGIMLLAKSGESSHRFDVEQCYNVSRDCPLVIVDDQISSGGTMKNIAKRLREHGYIDQVQAVAIHRAIDNQELLKELFPNLKLIIS